MPRAQITVITPRKKRIAKIGDVKSISLNPVAETKKAPLAKDLPVIVPACSFTMLASTIKHLSKNCQPIVSIKIIVIFSYHPVVHK